MISQISSRSLEDSAELSSGLASPTSRLSNSFHYDKELLRQCHTYIEQNNHHGLALIARQKGLPPFLRSKVWPILLKHHPFVAHPFIQPDNVPSTADQAKSTDSQLQQSIRKDLRRYMHGIAHSSAEEPLTERELEIFDILERAIKKFVGKWGQIIKYDPALTWIALGLAEWCPPIPNTPWVLLGRDVSSQEKTCVGSVYEEYEKYIRAIPELQNLLLDNPEDQCTPNLRFHEVYERLALVLLHSPESANKRKNNKKSFKVDKFSLPISGGTIEERVSFFIHIFQKLLPELSDYFQDEQILNKFGQQEDGWLIWWLKFCGSKVWSRVDRGRVWDLLLGWRLQSKKLESNKNYYSDKLHISDDLLNKLGPDVFWSVDHNEDNTVRLSKDDSFKDLINDLHIDWKQSPSSSSSEGPLPMLSPPDQKILESFSEAAKPAIPFCKLDPHIELIFVSLALMKAKENILVELDQHEIRTYLSRLPAKSYNLSNKYKEYQVQNGKDVNEQVGEGFKYDYMDSIIYEAGELWRKWLWMGMNGEN
ncbi:hypothetical protein PUMCH_004148 [Australozyma saopauloensis]|uniref:Rab-GAP TBC domain-containing protein n=1 Tax=Australozyma saopauloensis TaxID=291208 RepID=A0AAX4HFX3_9ASCO|nr:hypothetical protein PUMCH_004148 [[Candida] saopauloensis]